MAHNTIDADRLKAEINNRLMAVDIEKLGNFGSHRVWAYNDVKDLINSLQQEQPKPSNNLVDVDAVREDFITEVYRVLNADPTNDRANAIIYAFDSLPTVTQEQPEVDLEKEIDDELDRNWRGHYIEHRRFVESAKYFYKLGLNAKNKD